MPARDNTTRRRTGCPQRWQRFNRQVSGRALLLTAALLTLTAPVHAELRVQPVTPPLQRLVQPGYQLQPPAEPGWVVASRSPYQLILGKAGSGVDESYIIEATLIHIPADQTDQLQQWVRESENRDSDPQRFAQQTHEVAAYEGKNTRCIASHTVSQDLQPHRRSGGNAPMVLELYAYTCLLPTNPTLALHLGYSYRHEPGHADPQLAQKANQLILGVLFTGM